MSANKPWFSVDFGTLRLPMTATVGGGMLMLWLLGLPIFANATATNANGSAVILLYHRFGEDAFPSTSIRLAQFDAQLVYLKQNHFHVWPLSRLVMALKAHQPIPDKTVVLTVDDAWKSVYTEAYPRVKALGWPMTVFVNTDPVDKHFPSNMTWQQMREMQQHGIEFANHTQTHGVLIQRSDESLSDWHHRLQHELETAQQRLQTELSHNTNQAKLFSYPYGEYSADSANLIAKLGYIAVSQSSGAVGYQSDLKDLLRFPMSEQYGSLASFALKVNTLVLPINRVEPFEPVVQENPPKMTLFFDNPQQGIHCFNHLGEPLNQQWKTPLILQVWSKTELAPPRDRYACTQQASDKRWRWFSHPWVINEPTQFLK